MGTIKELRELEEETSRLEKELEDLRLRRIKIRNERLEAEDAERRSRVRESYSFFGRMEGMGGSEDYEHHGSYGSPRAIESAFIQEWEFSDRGEDTEKDLIGKYSRKLASGYHFKMSDASERLKVLLKRHMERSERL